MQQRYLPTGNEFISIPKLNESGAAIEDLTFLHMGGRGLIELRGGPAQPLMAPFVEVVGARAQLTGLEWTRLQYWAPRFSGRAGDICVSGTILAPVGERGFVYRLSLQNSGDAACSLAFGLEGCWGSAWHCVNESKEIEGTKRCYDSPWNGGPVFDMRCGLPLFAFAPMSDGGELLHRVAQTEDGVAYRLEHRARLAPGERCEASFFWGFGFEEVAAATSAKEMLRQGYARLEAATLCWLGSRSYWTEDARLREVYNTNLFFCLFFSTGLTLDTEELVLVTSRSPRYYVSAAYWDRDSLLWSFPAILDADSRLARGMLEYVFGRQRRNIGVHSRFIDGTVLEPGFELDELMAPVLALDGYITTTGDVSLLEERGVRRGLAEILEKLDARRHGSVELYATFLQPTDDETVYPYLTYDNVLVWKGLGILARLLGDESLLLRAERVRQAIWTHCVVRGPDGGYFAWSVDLEGRHDVYDEPPGSLRLLPHLGFCDAQDQTYRKTVSLIRSPDYPYSFAGCEFAETGCAHAPHPWLLSVGNSLLSGEAERALDILKRAPMDNGVVCESIDEHTGVCATGEAFATCAGFICHAMRRALEGSANA